jgi:hypothetical protein
MHGVKWVEKRRFKNRHAVHRILPRGRYKHWLITMTIVTCLILCELQAASPIMELVPLFSFTCLPHIWRHCLLGILSHNQVAILVLVTMVALPTLQLQRHFLPWRSYLGYGQKAARAAMLSQPSVAAAGGASPCVPVGYTGTWKFNGKTFELKPPPTGSDPGACYSVELSALNTNKPCGAPQRECTFDGAWGGKRASKEAMLLSSFWYSAVFAGAARL